MLHIRRLTLFALLSGLLTSGIASAGTLQFEGAWVPEAPPVAPVLGGYVQISNSGNKDVTITATESPDFASVEIHDMQMHDGMMRMIKQDKLTIPAGGQVELKPGGFHLMLMKPKRAFKQGDTLEVTFTMADGQSDTVSFEVMQREMHDGHHHH
jgi:copper(I)-binding protein